MHTLIWKEFREGLPMWIESAVLVLLVVLPGALLGYPARGFGLHNRDLNLFTVVWSLFALALPAFSLAGEQEKQTLSYLESLPLSRTRIWTSKTLISAVFLLGLMILTLIVASVTSGGFFFVIIPWPDVLFSGALAFLLLSVSLVCAGLFRTTSTALGAAVAAGAALLCAGIVLMGQTGLRPDLEPLSTAFGLMTAALFFAFLSLAIFARQEFFPGRGSTRLLSRGLLIPALGILVFLIGLGQWMRLAPSRDQVSTVLHLETSVGKDVYFSALGRSGEPLGLWYVTPDGLDYGRLTTRRFNRPILTAGFPRRLFALAQQSREGDASSLLIWLDAQATSGTLQFPQERHLLSPSCKITEVREGRQRYERLLAIRQRCEGNSASDTLWIAGAPSARNSLKVLPTGELQGRIVFMEWIHGGLICCQREGEKTRILFIDPRASQGMTAAALKRAGVIRELYAREGSMEVLSVEPSGKALFLLPGTKGQSVITAGPVGEDPLSPDAVHLYQGPVTGAEAVPGRSGFACAVETPDESYLIYRPFEEGETKVLSIPKGIRNLALSPDDALALFLAPDNTVLVTNLETRTTRTLATRVSLFSGPSAFVHPRKVVFARSGGEVWVADIETGGKKRIF